MVMNWFEDDISPDELTEKYKSKLNMYHQNFGLGNMKNKELGEK